MSHSTHLFPPRPLSVSIRIIRNSKNMGAGASRNAGIEAAKGEYISFVDPDDHVAPDYFARLYSCAVKYKVPVVKGRRVYIDDRGNVTAGQGSIVNQQIRKSVKHNAPLYFRFINEHNSAIFKRSLADNSVARYGNTALAEDSTFLRHILLQAASWSGDRRLYCKELFR